MDLLPNVISSVALVVAVLSALFTWRESRKTRAERVEDRVREIALSGVRALTYGINSAQLARDFDEPPAMFTEYETSGLHDLAPRLRRDEDRAAVLKIAQSIDTVGAHWVDTMSAYGWWQEEVTPAMVNPQPTDPGRVAEAFARFDDRRRTFIDLGESLLGDIKALVARIDARYR